MPPESGQHFKECFIFKLNQRFNRKHLFSSLLWILPFGGFVVGYFATNHFLCSGQLTTPNIIGKPLAEAIFVLSNNKLGMRLLMQQENVTVPEGTILDQVPKPLQKIRPHQNVFVTISTKKQLSYAFDSWSKQYQDALDLAAQKKIEVEAFFLHSQYPSGMCIAQSPAVGQQLEKNKIIVYISSGEKKLSIMPDFRGLFLTDIQADLANYDVRAEIFHVDQQLTDHTCSSCKIIDQQPTPGSIVDRSKSLHVQFSVAAL